jgi:hypothetical protein
LEKELSSLTIAGAHLDFREAQQRLDCIHSHAVWSLWAMVWIAELCATPARQRMPGRRTGAAACWKVGAFLLNSKSVGSFANSEEFLCHV